ncbi:MAG TPA: hypothetical protein VLL52_12425, partial [Anaerolineae bacterium]|nr:hypothetical protein [Anaerolineae bacterium]
SSDVRLVVMGGRVRQGVVRMSDSPMTNLHLLNERGDLGEWIEGVGEERWEMVRGAAERAVGCWPGAFYAGVDLALTEDKKRVFVLEVNAFGDLLPRVMWAGEDTYGVFVREVLGGKTSK